MLKFLNKDKNTNICKCIFADDSNVYIYIFVYLAETTINIIIYNYLTLRNRILHTNLILYTKNLAVVQRNIKTSYFCNFFYIKHISNNEKQEYYTLNKVIKYI